MRAADVTTPIPSQRGPLLDTAAVAVMLGRTPGYVRLLAHRGKLTPVGAEDNGRGRVRMLFDAEQVFALLRDTPTHARHA